MDCSAGRVALVSAVCESVAFLRSHSRRRSSSIIQFIAARLCIAGRKLFRSYCRSLTHARFKMCRYRTLARWMAGMSSVAPPSELVLSVVCRWQQHQRNNNDNVVVDSVLLIALLYIFLFSFYRSGVYFGCLAYNGGLAHNASLQVFARICAKHAAPTLSACATKTTACSNVGRIPQKLCL